MQRRRITQAKFERVIAKFENRESGRAQLYPMALRLRDARFEIEADLLILATWNFAAFRYVMRTFNIQDFREAIEQTTPHFQRLADQQFQTADFDALAEDVTAIYDTFKAIAKQTGASKIIHLRQPYLFVMWDTDIRKELWLCEPFIRSRLYQISEGDAVTLQPYQLVTHGQNSAQGH